MDNHTVLIGLDGGATKISGWTIAFDTKTRLFSLGKYSASRAYQDIEGYIADFEPVPIPTQLMERDQGNFRLRSDEKIQGKALVEACAQVIESLAQQSKAGQIITGLGMPGLKTMSKRGIAVLANGPRIIDYSDQLEKRLDDSGIHFFSPVAHLGSDADYCGIGENYSSEGLFRDVRTAYYLGGGTGVADALKINGKLIPFDQAKDWIAKTWEMKSEDGRSLERYTSMGGLQSVYAEITGKEISQLNRQGIYPLQIAERASNQELAAKKMTAIAVDNLSKLIYERIVTLYAGSDNSIKFVSPKRPGLKKDHPYLKSLFERIIIGQRLGELFESEHGKLQFRQAFIEKLHKMIQQSKRLDNRAKNHYRSLDKIIVSSRLREAPSLGAGIDAYFSLSGMGRQIPPIN